MHIVKASLIAVLLGPVAGMAVAAQPNSAQEQAMLPDYCNYTYGGVKAGDAAGRSYWLQRLGPEMAHMHHYCNGLRLIARARTSLPKERGKWYAASVGEFDYVLRNVSESYVLMPEVLTRRGEALLRVNRLSESEESLKKSIELKPDYWPAYALLAERFMASKNPDAAREILKQGLSRAQETRALQRMLDEINKSPH